MKPSYVLASSARNVVLGYQSRHMELIVRRKGKATMANDNTIDLDNPKDARKFLRGVRIAGKPIDFIELTDGRQLFVENMTDKQVVRYAKDVYFDYCGGTEGQGGEIHLEGVDQ